MNKTEQEINAEKAAKPRPDLVPAQALLQVLSATDAWRDHGAQNTDYALMALLLFRQKCSVDFLVAAGACLVHALGGKAAAHMAGGRVMGYGFRKHGNCTWRVAGSEQADVQTHIASAERHLIERMENAGAVEEGSGLPVLEHAFSQVCIAIDLMLDPPRLLGENDGHGTVTGRIEAQRRDMIDEQALLRIVNVGSDKN